MTPRKKPPEDDWGDGSPSLQAKAEAPLVEGWPKQGQAGVWAILTNTAPGTPQPPQLLCDECKARQVANLGATFQFVGWGRSLEPCDVCEKVPGATKAEP